MSESERRRRGGGGGADEKQKPTEFVINYEKREGRDGERHC